MRISKTFTYIISLAILGFAFSGCSQDVENRGQTQLQKVRIGYLPIAAGLPLFVALEHGLFQAAGFDVELHRFTSSNDLGTAGAAQQVDAMMPFALNAAFDIGAASGIQHKLFGLNIYSDQPPHIVDSFVVRTGSGIDALSDIRGKRVGGFPGSVTRIFVENILEGHGVKPGEYTYLELGPKDWQAALTAGSIDAASVMEPQLSQITEDGVATVLISGFFAKMMPDVPLSGHWVTSEYATTRKPDEIYRSAAVFDQAVDFIREHPEEAKKAYPKYTAIREDILPKISLNIWNKSTEINAAHVQRYIDLLYEKGGIKARETASDYLLSPAKH